MPAIRSATLPWGRAAGAQATQVTLHIRGEHRDTRIAEQLGQVLQGDGLAGTGRPRHQTMAIGQAHGLRHGLAIRASPYNHLRRI